MRIGLPLHDMPDTKGRIQMKCAFILGLTLLAGTLSGQTVTAPMHGQLYHGRCVPAFAADVCDSVVIAVAPGSKNVVDIIFVKDHRPIVGLEGTLPVDPNSGEWVVTNQVQFQEGPADQFSALLTSYLDMSGAKPVTKPATGACTLTYEHLGGWDQEGPLIEVECGGTPMQLSPNVYMDNLGLWTDLKPPELVPNDKPSAEMKPEAILKPTPTKPSAEVKELIDREASLNSMCMNGVRNPQGVSSRKLTMKVCIIHAEVVTALQAKGWCWTGDELPRPSSDWEPCSGPKTPPKAIK